MVRRLLLPLVALATLGSLTLVQGQIFGSGGLKVTGTKTSTYVPTVQADGSVIWALPPGASGGEANTASNLGTGIGVFKLKNLVNLQFKSFQSANNMLTVTANADGNHVDLTVVPANFTLTTSQITGLDTALAAKYQAGANASFNNVTATPLSDVMAGTFRRFSAAQASNIVEFQTEGNVALASIDKAGVYNGPLTGPYLTINATGAGTVVAARTHASTVLTNPFFGVQNSSNTWLGGILGNGKLNVPAVSDGCATWSSGTLDSTGTACGSGGGGTVASQAEAEAGTNNTNIMTALRVDQYAKALVQAGDGLTVTPLTSGIEFAVNSTVGRVSTATIATIPGSCTHAGDVLTVSDATAGHKNRICDGANWFEPAGTGGGGATIASTSSVLKGDGAGNGVAAVAGTDFAAASHTHAATDLASGTVATARLGSGTANTTTFLRGDNTWATPGGSGTVTVVSSGSLTSTALVTGGGTTTLQTPAATATMDSSGNISTPGSISVGAGGTVAGYVDLGQGTQPAVGTTSVRLYSPTAVTAYRVELPGSAATGYLKGTNTGGVVALTWDAGTGSGAAWGSITGTLSSQTDLNTALAAKAPLASPVFTGNPTITNFTNATHNHTSTAQGTTLSNLAFNNTGTTTTVLHGNAAGTASWGAVGLTTDVSGILPVANGGTNNAFFTVAGPATSAKTYTFPNASANVLTDNAAVTVAQGGTGAATLTGVVRGSGTSALTASELSGDVTTSGSNAVTLATKHKTRMVSMTLLDPVVGDSGRVQFSLPNASTITRVSCSVKAATSVTINLDERAEATPDTAGTAVLTSGLVCDTDSQASTTFTNAGIASRVPVALTISAVSGTPDTLRVFVEYTVD